MRTIKSGGGASFLTSRGAYWLLALPLVLAAFALGLQVRPRRCPGVKLDNCFQYSSLHNRQQRFPGSRPDTAGSCPLLSFDALLSPCLWDSRSLFFTMHLAHLASPMQSFLGAPAKISGPCKPNAPDDLSEGLRQWKQTTHVCLLVSSSATRGTQTSGQQVVRRSYPAGFRPEHRPCCQEASIPFMAPRTVSPAKPGPCTDSTLTVRLKVQWSTHTRIEQQRQNGFPG